MSVLERAMVRQFHEQHIECVGTEDVPPQVRLSKSMSHAFVMGELAKANTDFTTEKSFICCLQQDLKMVYFDGSHTLKFIYHSKRLTAFYLGRNLRLQRVVIEVDESGNLLSGTDTQPHLRRLYLIRILGADQIGTATVVQALPRSLAYRCWMQNVLAWGPLQ
ncbi:hypothetical protein GN244_ATG13157 [Phytophthora infestans]|uniref:Uncharacterized protein n=1 Tax=Phytophthora infestans TaxID=4787 RepID=A0A833SYF2_PHYIN|nr:hypothetical protein GN244_ATG13157 [Phytophthora infestans]